MNPKLRAALWVLLVAVFAATVWVILDGLTDRLTSAEERANDNQQKVGALASQVESLGEKPVATTSKPLPQRLRYVPVVGPRGPQGVAGRDGDDSTVPGPTGRPGRDGADSTVPGPAGESITGPAGKDGAAGKDGRDGTNGRDGVSVTGVSCSGGLTEQFTLTFTLSDGSTITATCGVLPPVPEPETTP